MLSSPTFRLNGPLPTYGFFLLLAGAGSERSRPCLSLEFLPLDFLGHLYPNFLLAGRHFRLSSPTFRFHGPLPTSFFLGRDSRDPAPFFSMPSLSEFRAGHLASPLLPWRHFQLSWPSVSFHGPLPTYGFFLLLAGAGSERSRPCLSLEFLHLHFRGHLSHSFPLRRGWHFLLESPSSSLHLPLFSTPFTLRFLPT